MTKRTDDFMGVAARAAAGLSAKVARVSAMYAGDDAPLTLSLEDVDKEMRETGHLYDDNCQRPACVKQRQMWAQAVQQVFSSGDPQGGGA